MAFCLVASDGWENVISVRHLAAKIAVTTSFHALEFLLLFFRKVIYNIVLQAQNLIHLFGFCSENITKNVSHVATVFIFATPHMLKMSVTLKIVKANNWTKGYQLVLRR
jgi:hydrogenase-4 membrane subunit HyfE